MNIVGNTIAGKGLSANPNRFISIQPIVIGAVYLLLLLLAGVSAIPALPIVFVWGISAGMVANTIQYWVTSAAFGAPEFANGLYLTAANLWYGHFWSLGKKKASISAFLILGK